MKAFRILFLLLPLMLPGALLAKDKKIYGVNENVLIAEISAQPIAAKLDTGASTASLGASNIALFEKDGQEWVRFTPQVPGAREMERPLARRSTIKLRAVGEKERAAGRHVRPVILLTMCFDGETRVVETSLTDRSHFNYPLLLGTVALRDFSAVVDPASEFLSRPDCK